MKKILTISLLALLSVLNLSLESSARKRPSSEDYVYIADPCVLLWDGVYYAYGTHSPDGIQVYRSTDLKHWEGPCGNTGDGLALSKGDTWGEFGFWAPEVYPVGGGFVMTYTAEEHVAVAWSDSPLGPFRQEQPYHSLFSDEKGIDSHIFTDDDGQKYLYWVRFPKGKGNTIFVTKIDPSLDQTDTTATECICSLPDSWERVDAKVAEGPFVFKHKGTYYLTYSCNHCRSHDYAVGYATSSSPAGPWTRFSGNPIIHRQGGFLGTGHHYFFQGKNGKMYVAFHAHYDSTKMNPRKMLISRVKFVSSEDGPDVLKVSDKVIVPTLVNKN